MNDLQLLTWVRGPCLNISIVIFVAGIFWRLFEVYSLGRKKDLSTPRQLAGASGWHTIMRRMLPAEGLLKKAPITYIGGGIFHVGLAVVVFLFAPHIKLIQSLVAVSWPALPSQFVDLAAIVTLAAMLVLLADRIKNPIKRFLSTFEDWFTWGLTFMPLLTGWLAARHLLLPYTTMLSLHIFLVELLLVFLPFTKLFHSFTVFGSRWFNGTANGHKGVAV